MIREIAGRLSAEQVTDLNLTFSQFGIPLKIEGHPNAGGRRDIVTDLLKAATDDKLLELAAYCGVSLEGAGLEPLPKGWQPLPKKYRNDLLHVVVQEQLDPGDFRSSNELMDGLSGFVLRFRDSQLLWAVGANPRNVHELTCRFSSLTADFYTNRFPQERVGELWKDQRALRGVAPGLGQRVCTRDAGARQVG
jgi:hypothetical protein